MKSVCTILSSITPIAHGLNHGLWRWIGLFYLITGCQPEATILPPLFETLTADRTHIDFENTLTSTNEFNIYKYRNYYNGGGVGVGDVNNDGLLDIYFTANLLPNRLYLNRGNFVFEDVTDTARVGGSRAWSTGVAMVDVNADGWLDIYVCNSGDVAGDNKQNELFVNNRDGTFTEQAEAMGLADAGFSTHANFFDYDKDGDQDLLLGNMGVNTNLAASREEPVTLYLKDFDNNRSLDPILSHYQDGVEYPYYSLDELTGQLVSLKKTYRSYRSYANSTFAEVFPRETLRGAGRLQAFTFESAYLENRGGGDFVRRALPIDMQMAPLYSFATDDFNQDGVTDVLAAGNFYANQIQYWQVRCVLRTFHDPLAERHHLAHRAPTPLRICRRRGGPGHSTAQYVGG